MKEDKTLVCRECGTEFVFSASEQEFYEEKGFTNEPGRCPGCRQARKQRMGINNERPAREGMNLRTREKIQIAAKKVAKFKAGAELSDALN